MSKSLLLLTVLVAASLTPLPAERAAAQGPAPFVIEFDEEQLTFLSDFGTMRALIGITECGIIDLAAGERTLVVGGVGTPAECNEPWRVVSLVPGNHPPLGNDLILMPGETVTADTVAPFPAVDGPDLPPFWVEVRTDVGSVTPAEFAALGTMTAYVGSVLCGTAEIDESGVLMTIPIGDDGTPSACRVAGAEITLVDGGGKRLAVRPSVGPGPYYELHNLTRDALGRGAPGPSAAGNAGLVPADDTSVPLAIGLLALTALLAGGRYVTHVAPPQSRFR